MGRPKNVGSLELLVLEELWRLGEATVVQVHENLQTRRRVAPTTVATILRRLEDKQLATHRTEDRRYIFRALIERRALRRSMLGELVDQLFGGSTAELMGHLVEDGEVDRRQLAKLRRLIDARRKGSKHAR